MKWIALFSAIGAAMFTTACSIEDTTEEPYIASAAQAITASGTQCGVATAVDNNSWYRVMANFYNAGSGAGCVTWNQSINWNWFTVSRSPGWVTTSGMPAGYPAIYQGCHYGTCSGGGYPRSVGAITSAVSNWQIDGLSSSGAWNASYDIWFNKSYNPSQGYPDGLEVMIWQAYQGGVQPAGSKVASVIKWNGRTYDKWVGSVNGTKVVSYVRTAGGVSHTSFDLMPFLRDCQRWDGLQASWYLQSIQAGFEIWQGGQGLTTSEFDVTVR
ncbi:GH12 family glycosyl hydrolase domain-containing protein [Sorangium sp. So ce1000]|uniref:GH12 family glycosyl hydrolase domain-containing protein n=1 Tax=Sorangium sp. So ce1000 TaxID=3133325 RepID=UPI003F640A23